MHHAPKSPTSWSASRCRSRSGSPPHCSARTGRHCARQTWKCCGGKAEEEEEVMKVRERRERVQRDFFEV